MRQLLFWGLLGLLLTSFAPVAPPNTVAELQAQYRLLDALHQRGQLADSVYAQERQALEAWALERFALDLQAGHLDQAVSAQRIDWLGSALYIAAAFIFLAILAPLLQLLAHWGRRWLRRLWGWQPLRLVLIQLGKAVSILWEPLAYCVLVAVLYFFPNEFSILVVSLLLSSLVSYSVYSRVPKERFDRIWGTGLAWFFTLVWSGIAYGFNHTWVGILSVGALITALGLSIWILPGMPWQNSQKLALGLVWRMMLVSLILTIGATFIFYIDFLPALTALRLPLRPFELGATTLFPLAYFVGLAYLTFADPLRRDQPWKRHLLRLFTLTLPLVTLSIALLFKIGSLFWMSAFFILFWSSERYYFLVYKKAGPIFTGLLMATLFATSGYWLKNFLPQVVIFLTSLGW